MKKWLQKDIIPINIMVSTRDFTWNTRHSQAIICTIKSYKSIYCYRYKTGGTLLTPYINGAYHRSSFFCGMLMFLKKN